MIYRVILEIEHLPDDPDDAEDNERPVIDANVSSRTILANSGQSQRSSSCAFRLPATDTG